MGVIAVGAAALRAARVAAPAIAATAVGFGVGSYIGGLSSGILGAQAGPDPYGDSSVYFPTELLQNDHYIEFVAKQTKGGGEGAIGGLLSAAGIGNGSIGSTVLGGTIRLPMPSNLSTDYNPEYSTPSLGPAVGMALKPSDQAIYGNSSMGGKSLNGNGLQGIMSAIGGAAAGTAASAAVSGINAAAGALGGGEGAAGALLKVAGGVAINPHKIVLFTGVGFREHQFTWKLSPKNRRESDLIRQIIAMFTYYSHPEYVAGGLFFKYPEFFQIRFRHPEYLFELQPSVCKDVRVNYHGQGYPAYIRDANGGGIPAPAEVELALTFMETEIITKQTLNPSIITQQNITPQPAQPLPAIGQNELRPDGLFNGIGGPTQTPTFGTGA